MPEITGLLLAAGKSQRFGSQKLLAEYHGMPLVMHSASALSNCDRVIAVINDDDLALNETLQSAGVETLINKDANRGMGSSIACGVKASPTSDGWCILPADMPNVSKSLVDQVYAELENGAAISAPYYQDQRGHPVGFSKRFFHELISLDGDFGARVVLERHPEDLFRVETGDPGILIDIDTPQDLAQLITSS